MTTSPNMLTTKAMVARAHDEIAKVLLSDGGSLIDIPMQTVMIAIEGEQNEKLDQLTHTFADLLEQNKASARRFWQWAGLLLTAGVGLGIGLGQALQ